MGKRTKTTTTKRRGRPAGSQNKSTKKGPSRKSRTAKPKYPLPPPGNSNLFGDNGSLFVASRSPEAPASSSADAHQSYWIEHGDSKAFDMEIALWNAINWRSYR